MSTVIASSPRCFWWQSEGCFRLNSGRSEPFAFQNAPEKLYYTHTSINNTAQIFLWLFSQYFISLVSPWYTNLWYTSLWRGASAIMQKITFLQSTQPVSYFDHRPIWKISFTRGEMVFYLLHDFHFTGNFRDYTLKMVSTCVCFDLQHTIGRLWAYTRYKLIRFVISSNSIWLRLYDFACYLKPSVACHILFCVGFYQEPMC